MRKTKFSIIAAGLMLSMSLAMMPITALAEENAQANTTTEINAEEKVQEEQAKDKETLSDAEGMHDKSELEDLSIAPKSEKDEADKDKDGKAVLEPRSAKNADADGPINHTVDFMVNGNSTPFTFTDSKDLISSDGNNPSKNHGAPYEKGNTLSKEYFIGWSPSENYGKDASAKLYYGSERASVLVADGITKLYPVYFSRLGVLGYINDNTAYINYEMTNGQTMPNAEIKGNSSEKTHDIIAKYDDSKETYEVALNSSFKMNKMLSHWLYVGNGSTIMTNTQGDQGSSAKHAKYTHVDLNVTLDKELDLNENLKLTFSSYYFQPYMVFDTTTRTKFDIVEVNGAEKWNIGELTSSNSPSTTFTIKNPNKVRTITVRTILRTNWGYGGKQMPGISARDVENTNMILSSESATITKENAKLLEADNRAAKASGIINGYVKMPAFIISLDQKIPDINAQNPLSIKFESARVHFDKNSTSLGDAEEQDLGTSKVAYNGDLSTDSFNIGKKPTPTPMGNDVDLGDTMADNPADIEINGVPYRFKEWNTQKDGSGTKFTERTKVAEDIEVYAIWEKVTTSVTTQKKGSVIVHFKDTEGKSIAGDIEAHKDVVVSETTTIKAGTELISENTIFSKKAFDVTNLRKSSIMVDGIKYIYKETKGNESGIIAEGLTEVSYIYEKEKMPTIDSNRPSDIKPGNNKKANDTNAKVTNKATPKTSVDDRTLLFSSAIVLSLLMLSALLKKKSESK